MEIIRNSIWSGASVLVRGLASFLSNKVISIYFGPSGITFLSHFQNLASIFIILPNDGINKGVVKFLSDKGLEKNVRSQYFYAGLLLSILLFLATVLVFFSLKGLFPNPFPETDNLWILIAVSLFGLQVLNYFFLSILLSSKRLPAYVIIHILGNILSLAFVLAFSQSMDFKWVLIGWALGPSLSVIASAIRVLSLGYFKVTGIRISELKKNLQGIGEFILVAISILLFTKLTDFGIREFSIINFKAEQTGFWQGVVRISDFYLMAYLAYLNMVFYPKASELANHKSESDRFIRSFFIRVLPFIGFGLLLIFLFKEEVLVLFFSKEFLPGADFFNYQLPGDFFKMHAWVLSFLLLAHARTRTFIILQAAMAIIYIFLATILSRQYGIDGLPMAHFFRYFLYWICLLFVFRTTLFARS